MKDVDVKTFMQRQWDVVFHYHADTLTENRRSTLVDEGVPFSLSGDFDSVVVKDTSEQLLGLAMVAFASIIFGVFRRI